MLETKSHPDIWNLNAIEEKNLSKGHRIAEAFVKVIGSWKFIICQTVALVIWTILNLFAFFQHWDPYPFILLNLILSLQAAYAAPIIMMSQNRQAERDRLEAHNDFLINKKAEHEIQIILNRLEKQDALLKEIHNMLKTQ